MKLPLKIAKILQQLIAGETISDSLAKSVLMENLIKENIVFRKGKHRKTLQLLSAENLSIYLHNQLQINDLNNYILALEDENASRHDFVKITTDSKNSKERAFKGFLVNCYHPISAELNFNSLMLNPADGSFIFIYDYETFQIPLDVTIVGVENAKNFREIAKQKYLFKDIKPLFISRYPQNQNKDFIKWMNSIPNNYLHFGDFDLAGIGIYLNEYKNHLQDKATFFVPSTVATDLQKHGNRARYNIQKINFDKESIAESDLSTLLNLINLEKKGLDQEFYIGK